MYQRLYDEIRFFFTRILTWYQIPGPRAFRDQPFVLFFPSSAFFAEFPCVILPPPDMASIPDPAIVPDLTASSSTTDTPFAGSGSIGLGGELQNLQAAYRLNGKNYLK